MIKQAGRIPSLQATCGTLEKRIIFLGNVGLNTLYHAKVEHPVFVMVKDFDHTGDYVPVTSLSLPDTKG